MHARLRFEPQQPPVVGHLEFLVDGQPLTGTPQWATAHDRVAAAVAVCLHGLVGAQEQLVVALTAATPPSRRPQERLYQRLGLERESAVYVFCAHGDEDSRSAELIVDVPASEVEDVVRLAWDWNSFRAYVIEAPTAAFLRELIETRDPERRRQLELEGCACVLQDWADATALRISSGRLPQVELKRRIDLDAIEHAWGA